MSEKVSISMCVGSACHLRGSREVIEAVQEEIARLGLGEQVELKGSFCLGKCGESGVTVKVNDDLILGVEPDGVSEFIATRVLPLLK